MDEHRIDQLDPVLVDRLNGDLIVVARDVEPIDPLSANLAHTVAENFFRVRHELRLEDGTDKWSQYRDGVLEKG